MTLVDLMNTLTTEDAFRFDHTGPLKVEVDGQEMPIVGVRAGADKAIVLLTTAQVADV